MFFTQPFIVFIDNSSLFLNNLYANLLQMSLEYILTSSSVLTATFALGFMGAFYRIYNNRNMKLFILLFILFYIQKFVMLIGNILQNEIVSSEIISAINNILDESFDLCFAALFIYFLYQVFNIEIKKSTILYAGLVYLFPWILKLLFAIFSINPESIMGFLLLNIDTLPLMVFILAIGYLAYQKLKHSVIKSLARITLVIISTVGFIILIDGIFESFFKLDLPKEPVIIIAYSLLSVKYCFIYVRFMKTMDTAIKDEFTSKYGISKREKEIVELLMKGYSYKNISSMLYISIATVKTHIHNIYLKTKVKSRNELMHIVLET